VSGRLNGLSVAAFALSLMVVFFQWDMRERGGPVDTPAPSGLRGYIAAITATGFVKFLRRQRFDRISFAFILLGIILVFAAKIGRMSVQTHV
jgi:hypothetical protein